MVLYNIPSRSVVNMSPELLAELAAENANVVAVKQANNDDLGPIEGLDVLAGNDEIFARTLGVRWRRRDPRRLARGRTADARALRAPRSRATHDRAEEIDAGLKPVYAAMARDREPDAGEDRARAARA